ncbi:phosphohydrolase [Weissella viridescens]|uniref:Hd family metal-dependent phosphohydrolase n=1 Tax=Weissella viridescens TaxID=1629 RepID=A0A0R2H7R1_WEIVI|nr:HD domain-containing protein [Weissella viridescens]KRN45946.1 hd family metal-dependent phosphohydrolase [Weissella viridescens]GEA95081.1 phosphohydrolase [Weissella viridescens]
MRKEKVLRDPVLNEIHVYDQVILDLIATPEFQRLRRVKQLGVTSEVFHGAEHSRFSHSLGVYEIARRIERHLAQFYPTQTNTDGLWNPEERLVLLCAALLHDLGHGAYSHTFEHIFNTDHEAYTQEIILSPTTQINAVLKQVASDFPEKVAQVIAKTYPNPQVVQLISSQIDADRMDYLLRDAYFTGATYGEFDLARIIQTIHPYAGGIAFADKGMNAIEDYVVSRYQMYVQVYFHPVSRAMEVLLQHLLERAKSVFENHAERGLSNGFMPKALMPLFEGDITLDEYLMIDDSVMLAAISEWRNSDDSVLADLSRRFLNRVPLKSIVIDEQTRSLLPQLRELVETAGFDTQYYTAENDSFDLPYDAYDPKARKPRTQIELRQQNGDLIELSQKSALVQALTGRVFGDARFFFPSEMLQEHPVEDMMAPVYADFQQYIENGQLIEPK